MADQKYYYCQTPLLATLADYHNYQHNKLILHETNTSKVYCTGRGASKATKKLVSDQHHVILNICLSDDQLSCDARSGTSPRKLNPRTDPSSAHTPRRCIDFTTTATLPPPPPHLPSFFSKLYHCISR